jgi:hypothetical protein
MEASHIIRLNINHYQELLKLKGDMADGLRPQVTKMLAQAQEQLPLAVAEEFERGLKPGSDFAAA